MKSWPPEDRSELSRFYKKDLDRLLSRGWTTVSLVVDPHTSESFINLILEVPGCVKRLCYRMGLAEYPPAPLYVGKFRVVKSVIAKVEQCNPPSVRGRIRT